MIIMIWFVSWLQCLFMYISFYSHIIKFKIIKMNRTKLNKLNLARLGLARLS